MCAVDDPVKDGIGEGLLTNDFMPIGYGPLRGYNSGSPEKFVVIIRPSLLKYIQKINVAHAIVVTSIWKDYEIRTENEVFFDWVDKEGYKRTHYHTSGHADQVGLKKIVAYISPKSIIPIHTVNKALYKEIFDHVLVLDDGETFEI